MKKTASSLRLKAEELYKARHETKLKSSAEDNAKLIHELGVFQIELELQNEELMAARDNAEASAARYRKLYDGAPAGYFTLDGSGRIDELNHAGAALLNTDLSMLNGTAFRSLVSAGTHPVFDNFLGMVFASKTRQTCLVQLSPDEKHSLVVQLDGIATEDGQKCFVSVTDVNERFKLEEALKVGEEKFRHLAENSPSIIYRLILKPELMFDYVSPSVTAMTGYTPEDHYSDPKLGFKIVHPDDRHLLENTTRLRQGEPLVLRWIRKDGAVIWTEQRNVLIFGQDGLPVAIEGQARDITETRNAEIKLRKVIDRNTLLLELFGQAPLLTDKEIYDQALEIAVQLTESKIGFFHQVSDDQKEIKLETWNSEAKKSCTANFQGHYPIAMAGNWADCVRHKQAVVYNDFQQSSNQKGLPDGHAPLDRFMSIPVIQDEKVRLIFGVGNKSFDYTDFDVVQLQSVANELYQILEKRGIEKALRKSEERWQFAIEGSNDGIWDWDVTTGEVYFSKRWKEILGYLPQEIDGKIEEWEKRVHPDDQQRILAMLDSHFMGETDQYATEYRMQGKDGTWKWIMDRGKVTEWTPEGKPSRMLGTLMDITERKMDEEQILNDRKKFRILNELMSDYIFELKPGEDGIFHMSIIAGNYEKATGYTSGEISSSADWYKIIHPDDLPYLQDHFARLIRDRQPVSIECRSYSHSGSLRWLEITATPETDVRTGKIISIYGNVKNITSKKQTEQTLSESEFKYRTLANAGSALIWTSGPDKLCNYFNNPWLSFTGRSLEQEIGNGWAEGVHPDDLDRCISIYVTSFDMRKPFEMEYRLRHSSGEYKWLLDMGTPNFSSTGEFLGYIGHCFDISERRLIEDTHRFLLTCGLPGTGEDFFKSLARFLAETLSMEYVCIDRLEGDGLTAQTVAVFNDGHFESNVQYSLQDTPCGKVAVQNVCCYREGVRYLFPYDAALQDLKAESYVGTTLHDSKGHAIGLIAVIGHSVLQEPERAETLLKLVASRAAGELERREAEEKLNLTLQELHLANLHLEERVKERTREISEISTFQKAILDNAPIGIYSTDMDGIFQSINPTGAEMLGCTTGEIIGKLSPLSFFDQNEIVNFCISTTGNRQPDEKEINSTINKEINHKTTEWTWVRKNGSKFPAKISHSTLVGADGNVSGYMVVLVDATQEKESIKALKESESRFNSMFQNHSAIMLLIDPETGEIVDANKSAGQFYGYDFSGSTRKKISELNTLVTGDVADSLDLASERKNNYFLFNHRLANGETRIVEVHSTPIATGTTTLLFSVIHNITERHIAEEALRKSEAENRAIINAVPDLMFRIHRNGTYLEMLTANESSLLIPEEQFIGKSVTEILPQNLAQQSMHFIEKAITSNSVVLYEYELEIRNSTMYFENRVIPISNEEVLSIIRDITGRKTAEMNLQEALRKLSTLIQNLQAGTLFEGDTRHITLVNQAFCNIFKLPATPEQLIGYDCVVASENTKHMMKDPAGFILRINDILSGGEIVTGDELALADGRVLERDYIPIKSGSTLLGHLWQYRDITDRKQSEAALRMQSAAFESFAMAIIITDVDSRIRWANSAFTKLTGYPVDEVVGRTPDELVKSGRQDKRFYSVLWETIQNKHVWNGELINRRKDGSLYHEEETITPVMDSEGNVAGFIAIKIDVTERKMLYQNLADEKRRLADIIKGTNAGTWEWNVQTGETVFNEQWASIIGYTLDEISPVSIETWMKYAHPNDLAESDSLLTKHFQGELDYYSFESRMKHKNGEWVWVLDQGRVHEWDSNGKPLLMSGTHLDISRQKQIEEALLKAKTDAEKANLAKSEFLSRMSHELRTPMNAILGFAQLLEMGQLNPSQRKGVNHILHGGKHLLDLINEVLDISGIEAGRLALSSEPLQLDNILREMINSVQPLAHSRQVQLNLIDSPVNSEFIKADRQRLRQVLMNLINNGVKYNRDGGTVSIRTELMPVRDNREFIRVSITDSGFGIQESDISKLFRPFERIGAENTGVEGSGLGLTIVKKLIEAMEGNLGVESTFGEGSTFWFELQRMDGMKTDIGKANQPKVPVDGGATGNGTILCIEDNPSNIELIEQVLSNQRPGIQLIVTMNGKSAFDLAVRHKPDLILLDLNLPDIPGHEVLTMLMGDLRTSNIPVIVVSADAMPHQKSLLMKDGAKGYLTKPLDIANFLQSIDTFLIDVK